MASPAAIIINIIIITTIAITIIMIIISIIIIISNIIVIIIAIFLMMVSLWLSGGAVTAQDVLIKQHQKHLSPAVVHFHRVDGNVSTLHALCILLAG